MPFGNKEFYLEDLLSSVFSQFKTYHPSGNLKLNNIGIFQSFKFLILMEEIPPVSLELNITPSTLGWWVTQNTYYPHFIFKSTTVQNSLKPAFRFYCADNIQKDHQVIFLESL